MKPFTRQLGPRSGVQLNPLADNTERFVGSNADQVFAIAGRFERGRIDKAFRVNRSNLQRKLGQPSSTAVSRLNEAHVHIYDTLQNGGYESVVYRLNTEDAENKFLVVKDDAVAANVWSASLTPAGHILAIKHLECFNDGIRAEINAEAVLGDDLAATATANVPLTGAMPLSIGGTAITDGARVSLTAQTTPAENGIYSCSVTGGNYTLVEADAEVPVASKWVTVRLRDKKTNDILFEFEGSLDPAAKDEFGTSTYLPNVVSMMTEDVEVAVATGADVSPTAAFYGLDTNGDAKFVQADLAYFTEGGTAYTLSDYDRACAALKYGDHDFGYIEGGGTRAIGLLSKLIFLGKDINTQVCWDIPGEYTPEAAIAFYEQLNIDTHYSQAYWAPLKSDDPVNGGKDYLGTSCINVGKRCSRNARTDANGIPPKNFVVAGKNWPLERTGIIQTYTPTEQELDDLARARINPVLFQKYTTGGKYVFVDSLTGAKTEADRKLIAVADMSSHVDEWVTQFAQECLQLPMESAVKAMSDFLPRLFESLETAKWIKPSKELAGKAFAFSVQPNNMRPSDRMDVGYWLKYDGTARAIYVQQTLSK